MNKRIFAIFSIAIFLIVSIGIISAADTQDDLSADADAVSNSKVIPVKIVWDDAAKTGARPASVTVNLIKDGAVVDTVTLSESNSWSATFKAQSADGSFKVTQSGSLVDYSVSISGSVDNGFVIVNQIKADALGASENEVPIAENASGDSNATDDQVSNDTAETNATDSDSNATDENSTDDSNATDGNSTVDNKTDNTPAKKPVSKEQIKQVVKPINVTKTQLRNTGIPLLVLVVVAFAAVFVPFSRNKK
ncbi:Cna B-type domain-containing protein [Methanobrevibacter sp.]|uniref:Cna B-type domain-containing protein n=1 Tax=Methanobrevibacter sp. TaxID=66852 RepID=UPI0025EE2E9C|nr:Cna B-type domain-containing protein [Methanobrevibacter sp.]